MAKGINKNILPEARATRSIAFSPDGQIKWKELGLDYRLGDSGPPTAEALVSACEQFRSMGLNAD